MIDRSAPAPTIETAESSYFKADRRDSPSWATSRVTICDGILFAVLMALTVGATAPDFTVKDTNGNTVKLSDYAGKMVVMYFYPKDDTPGCTKQACSFRDNYEQYLSKGITVFGVSLDDASSHKAFTDKFNLPFPLLADTDAAITTAYGVVTDRNGTRYAQRVTYVINDGKIQQVYDTINTETHATDVLTSIAA
jgi:thioredoxin-dependent peroxiredoxin